MTPGHLYTAVVILVTILIVYASARWISQLVCGKRDKFVSKEAKEVYATAGPLLEQTGGKPKYSVYKNRVPHADAVQYTDVKKLWEKGKFTPENVQAAL